MTHGPAPESEVDANDVRPTLRRPSPGPPALAVAGVLCVLGAGLLYAIEGHRKAPETMGGVAGTNGASRVAPPETPELQIPPPPPPAPPPQPQIVYVQRPAPPPIIQYIDRPQPPHPSPSANTNAKLAEPVLSIDLAAAAQATTGTNGDDTPAQAVMLHNRSTLVPQGSLIPAVIESAINTNDPGPVRAVTTGDTRGFDGTRILIPRGSRLVGELHGGAGASLDRASVIWTRLVRPDGVAIRFTSPSTDFEGGVGVPGKVNNHILARFASAVLQSALEVGTLLAAPPTNGSLILGLPLQNAGSNVQTIIPPLPTTPTITVRAGAPIMIFVTRDLDFAGVSPKR